MTKFRDTGKKADFGPFFGPFWAKMAKNGALLKNPPTSISADHGSDIKNTLGALSD